MIKQNNFAIYYTGDAYSTAQKIMGHQSAGKAFMCGIARTWPQATLHGIGSGAPAAKAMLNQLKGDGFTSELRWMKFLNGLHWAK